VIYAVGDIHGQVTMLRAMLDRLRSLPLRDDDILIFIGDYIDRGEDSRAVIQTLLQLREERSGVVFLRGNHEQLILEARKGPPPEPADREGYMLLAESLLNWLQNGGAETLYSYGVEDFMRWWEFIPESHWEFIRATELEYITEHYHFVHAGLLPPGKTWEGADWDLDPRLWIREPFLKSKADFGGRRVVFGHTPQTSGRPLLQRNKIGIDTGAVYGGPLTTVVLEENFTGRRPPPPRFIQVPYDRADIPEE